LGPSDPVLKIRIQSTGLHAVRIEGAGSAAGRQLRLAAADQWGALWNELHTAQQGVVSRDAYCAAAHPLPGGAEITPGQVIDTPVHLDGVPETIGSLVAAGIVVGHSTITSTTQKVLQGRRRRWTLSDAAVQAYMAGLCPACRT
jgi:hypothetical protein